MLAGPRTASQHISRVTVPQGSSPDSPDGEVDEDGNETALQVASEPEFGSRGRSGRLDDSFPESSQDFMDGNLPDTPESVRVLVPVTETQPLLLPEIAAKGPQRYGTTHPHIVLTMKGSRDAEESD
jgi:hypothetical protein